MPIEVLHTQPPEEAFTSLETHQSQTPQTFFSSPPVLHFSTKNATLVLPASQPGTSDLPLFSSSGSHEASPGQNGYSPDDPHVIKSVDVWVTSESLLLFSPPLKTGLSIPYPTISLHAIQRLHLPSAQPSEPEHQGLYMQLATSSNPADDEDGSLEVTLILHPPNITFVPVLPNTLEPTASPSASGSLPAPADDEIPTDPDYGPGETDQSRIPLIRQLYEAVSACSDLHPDEDSQPSDHGDEEDEDDGDKIAYEHGADDGGLPPPFPGSGGWITAENVHRFVDEEGNFVGRGPGSGVRRVRGRDEDGGEDREEEVVEGKWMRTG